MTLTFAPANSEEEVKTVGLIGEFLFYKSNLTGSTDETGMVEHDPKYMPTQYEPGMYQIGGRYYQEMKQDKKTGLFAATVKLPAGVYPYGFVINGELAEPETDERMAWQNFIAEDGEYHSFKDHNLWILDPKNLPSAPTKTGPQMNSELYVGTAEDCPWIPATNPAVRGTVTYVSYQDINGADQTLGVYLPANYDRTKEYPLIFVSHGGGGNEADWFCQGGMNNIMDKLIAGCKTQEAVVVTMNNSVYGWEFPVIDQNLLQCILPYVQRVFAVTKDPAKTAFCGLSMGSITTLYTYMYHPERFRYFGAFSGGFAGGEGFTMDNQELHNVTLLIGSAEENIAYNERDIGVPPTIRVLKEKGLPHIPYFVPGSHDWFCWSAMFTYFAEKVLWK